MVSILIAMSITLHWFLPTDADSRSDLSLGNFLTNGALPPNHAQL
jgi:hypothetical protein